MLVSENIGEQLIVIFAGAGTNRIGTGAQTLVLGSGADTEYLMARCRQLF